MTEPVPPSVSVSAAPVATPAAPAPDILDLNWAELFPSDPGARVPTQPAPAASPASPAPVPAPAPQPPALPAEFLKTSTGTVYKTSEDAVKGIEHKDTLIEQLRQRYILERGIDPITNQPVYQTPQTPVPYTQDPKRYFGDLVNSVQKNDPASYLATQQQLILDTLGPIAPLITQMARAQATDSVVNELKDFREFSASDGYRKVMDEMPDLKSAIELAESDYRFHSRLPGLYKIAYWTAQGRRMPELLKTQPQVPSAQPVPATIPPVTVTPPTGPAGTPDPNTHAGRQAIIASMEAKGVDKLVW